MTNSFITLKSAYLVIVLMFVVIMASAGQASAQDEFDALNVTSTGRLDFEQDVNEDAFPDGWYRVKEPESPHYVEGVWDGAERLSGGHSLRLDLKGASISYVSDRFLLNPAYDYLFTGYIKTAGVASQGILATKVFYRLNVLNSEKKVIETVALSGLTGNNDWTSFRFSANRFKTFTEPVYLEITCNIVGKSLDGAVWFDGIMLNQVPRITISMEKPLPVFAKGVDKNIHLKITGLDKKPYRFRCLAASATTGKDTVLSESEVNSNKGALTLLDTVEKTIPIPTDTVDAIEFRTDVFSLAGNDSILVNRNVRAILIVKTPQHIGRDKFFAVAIDPYSQKSESIKMILDVLPVDVVKISLWNSSYTFSELETHFPDMLTLLDEVRSIRALPVGVLDGLSVKTPDDNDGSTLRAYFSGELFKQDPSLWKDALSETLNRFSDVVRYWQLTPDSVSTDASATSDFSEAMDLVRSFVVGARVGVPVSYAVNPEDVKGIDFLSVRLYDDMTPEAFDEYIQDFLQSYSSDYIETWVATPVMSEKFSLAERIADLTKKTVIAKYHNIPTFIIDDSIGENGSFFRPDARVQPVLLGYYHLYDMLAGYRCSNHFTTNDGTDVYVFTSVSDVRFVIWNSLKNCDETFYLPSTVNIFNVFGQEIAPDYEGGKLTVNAGNIPLFITGIPEEDYHLIRGLTLTISQLTATIDDQHIKFRYTNDLDESIQAKLTFLIDDAWSSDKMHFSFNLEAGKTYEDKIKVNLPYNELAGLHYIEAAGTFETSSQKYIKRFKLPVEVKLDGFDVNIKKKISDSALLVSLTVHNLTGKNHNISAYCYLGDKRIEPLNPGMTVGTSQKATFFFKIPNIVSLKEKRCLVGFTVENDPRFYNRLITIKEDGAVIISE